MDWNKIEETKWGFWLLVVGVWQDVILDCRKVKLVETEHKGKTFKDYVTRVKLDGGNWQPAKIESWAMRDLKPFIVETGQEEDDVVNFSVKREIDDETGRSTLAFRKV